ncbi:M4 family metallopeptidase [Ichthyenterobacterium sp. W332]|uniref:M4 family metallopeptidase n=1 Tax=Microcosmobacter mediterraneus TaxID=3075607 RepID=A0ABU2YGA7_9FLAO|nr:M4 family metallopeptidase [Ichthyenterobacterium sp. W332]MDT0557193.1 M4 family metallopeptidase [Ichthyenterobacterium sp. W332]
MKKILTIITSLLVFCTVFGQNKSEKLSQLFRLTKAKITLNQSTQVPNFIKFNPNSSLQLRGTSVQDKALSFLEDYKAIYGISEVSANLRLADVKVDNYGMKRVILKQEHDNVPVFDSELRFHFNTNNDLTAINGNFMPNIKLNATPSIPKSQANTIALNTISGTNLEVYKSTLFVFPKGLVEGYVSGYHLVYEVEVVNYSDVREFIYVNAHNGSIVQQFTGIAHALDRVVSENNDGNVVWEEGDAFPGILDLWQQNEVVVSAHMYNFFKNAFNYVSYDGADAQMRTVNNNVNIPCPNATWNGFTANFCDGTASDDVIAHEWGHAYTQFTNNLIYAFQSGAINEAYSDIWGETIDILNNYEDDDEDLSLRTGCNSSERWIMGEDATAIAGGNGLRDLWDPTCRNDPGKVTDGEYSCGNFDLGGVHINSGIPNHAYALLVDGGNFNGFDVGGIGFTKTAHIFWRAQSTYLTATSDFEDLADALEASAQDLLGINLEGLTTEEVPAGPSGEVIIPRDIDQVIAAIFAVEMRINPDACGYEPLLGPTDPLCGAASTGQIFFEDWEAGIGLWTVEQLPVNASTWTPRDWEVVSGLPDGRLGSAIFAADPIIGNCGSDLENGLMRLNSPVMTMPDFSDGIYEMAFDHYVLTEFLWDGGNIKYSLDGGDWTLVPSASFLTNPYNTDLNAASAGNDNPIAGEPSFTGQDGGTVSSSWGQSSIDLSSLGVTANSSIQFRFEFGSDGCNGRLGWFVDEIVVYNCALESLSVDEENLLASTLQVYPNPSNGLFTLKKTTLIELERTEVYDINGRVVKALSLKGMGSEKQIDLTNAASGIYFMRVQTETASKTFKLIKQ